MKAAFKIIAKTWNIIKDNKHIRRSVIILWAVCIMQYGLNMLKPLIFSAVLDGTVETIKAGQITTTLCFGFFGLLITGVYFWIAGTKTRPLYEETSHNISIQIKKSIYRKICKISFSMFNSPRIYEKINLINSSYPGYCADFLTGQSICSILGTTISVLFTIVILVSISPLVAVVMVAGNLFGIFKTWLEAKVNYYAIVENMSDRRFANAYRDTLFDRDKIKEVKFYGLTGYISSRWHDYTAKANGRTIKYQVLFLILDTITYAFANAFSIAGLIITAGLILRGKASLGAFLLVYNSSFSLIDTSGSLLNSFKNIRMAKKYYEDYNDFCDLPEVEPSENVQVNDSAPFDICFEHVNFTYEGNEKKTIDDLNLEIKQGEKVAIVGENGSGKSTIISLLNRLYEPDSGNILIGGNDIKKSISKLRWQISTVFQDFGKYETNFRENIAIGDIKNEYSDEELLKCAQKTNIDKKIMSEPNGLDTPIGRFSEGGINLSGGEWQKLSMARSLIRNSAQVVIMDEPNASLDPISESQIYKRVFEDLNTPQNNQTLILITHRLGATKYVNRIVVIDKGRVAEDGTHSELMAKNGVYAKMYNAQAKWYE